MHPITLKCFVLCLFQIVNALQPKKIVPNKPNNVFSDAAAVTNSNLCTNIALEILSEEGSAADAAIAAMLCEGVTNPQSMGIGGGFLLTYYSSANKTVEYLNAREVAPSDSSRDMFGHMASNDVSAGGLAVAIPGELKGYWALHKKYGRISWYDLFRPAIQLCRDGVKVTSYTAEMIGRVREEIMASPSIKLLLTNPQTGSLYREGELMMRPDLAETLELVAKHGPDVLYNGILTGDFLYDIQDNGGIITAEDLRTYKVHWYPAYSRQIGEYLIHTTPKPGSGQLLILILEVMTRKMSNNDILFWHRLVETWKFAFGLRTTMTAPKMGEPDKTVVGQRELNKILDKIKDYKGYPNVKDYFAKSKAAEDHGTSHICILAPNGDAIAVTSTINLSFGALFVSESTGIILNNEMIDFSIPNHFSFKPHIANFVEPLRYPMSSMLPTIVTNPDMDEVRLVIGASGGFKIITATSIVMLEHLYMGKTLERAVYQKRIHHQLQPMVLEYEEGFSGPVLKEFVKMGHRLKSMDKSPDTNKSTECVPIKSGVNAIAVIGEDIHAVGDERRKAYAGGY